jgi:hypothetical protein
LRRSRQYRQELQIGRERGVAVRLAPGIRRIYDAEILFGDPP